MDIGPVPAAGTGDPMSDTIPQPDAPRSQPAVPEDRTRQLVFNKHGQSFIFRFAPGEESRVLESLAAMARDKDSGVDWFDAAVLSHQLGRQISADLDQLLKP
jgi:hypothetical protein